MEKFIFYCFMASILITGVMNDFCTDVDQIDRIFSISDFIYLQKNQKVYSYKSNTSLVGNPGSNIKNFFRVDFQSLNTGFYIDSVPDCKGSASYCNDMKKFVKMSFVIGHKSPFKEQAYVAYKLIKDKYLTPITDAKEMPFQMKTEDQIEAGTLWPLKAEGRKAIYRLSAFIKSRFEIVHFIFIFTDPKEYVFWTSLERLDWATNWVKVEPSLSASNLMPVFLGMFQFNQNSYAIARLENRQSLFSYDRNGTFTEESNINLRGDIYGCQIASTSVPSDATLANQTNSSGTVISTETSPQDKNETTTGIVEPSESIGTSIVIILIVVFVIIISITLIVLFIIYKYQTCPPISSRSKSLSESESSSEEIKNMPSNSVKESSNQSENAQTNKEQKETLQTGP